MEKSSILEAKNSRSFLIFGFIIVCVGIAHSLGFIHDFRMMLAHATGLPLKEWKESAQKITESTYINVGPMIIGSGILVMAIGKIADIGAAYSKFRGSKK